MQNCCRVMHLLASCVATQQSQLRDVSNASFVALYAPSYGYDARIFIAFVT